MNKWLLYYNVVKVSDMNTCSLNDSPSLLTHSDNTRCPGYSTSNVLFTSYGRNPMGFSVNIGQREVCVSSRQEYYASFCNHTLSKLVKDDKSI